MVFLLGLFLAYGAVRTVGSPKECSGASAQSANGTQRETVRKGETMRETVLRERGDRDRQTGSLDGALDGAVLKPCP